MGGVETSQEVQPAKRPETPAVPPPAPDIEDPETTHVQRKAPPAPVPHEPSRPVRQTIDIGSRRSSAPIWIIGAVVLVLIVRGLGVSGFLLWRSKQQSRRAQHRRQRPPSAATRKRTS